MTGNVPVAVGYGNGTGAPAGFLFATVVLSIFAVGYVAMARHITTAGAFYGFVSHGLGRPLGMASGFLMLAAYMTMEASLVGIFAAFFDGTMNSQVGVDLPWLVYAAVVLLLNGILAYFDIGLAARVLAVLLLTEIGILLLMALSVIFSGGGPDGIPLSPLNPANAFSGNGLAAPVVGLGLLMAFWSWVGFESTALYGEESRNPKKIVPLATMIAVIGIGVFYTFISWSAIAGNGLQGSLDIAGGDAPFELLFSPLREFVGGGAVTVFEWLLISGSFACSFAIHNSAARYLYALGREGILPRSLGRTHREHGSPYMASFVQTGVAATVVLLFALFKQDPYLSLFTLIAIMATIAILIVQTLCSIAVIGYFHAQHQHPETANVFRTLLAPIVGGLGMLLVLYLMLSNLSAAAGAASETLFFKLMPYIVIAVFIAGIAYGLWLKSRNPQLYARIGRVVFEESAGGPGLDVSGDGHAEAVPAAAGGYRH
jgi:amino acid transporter